MTSPPPPPSGLQQRAWLAYLAQELAAPAAALAAHARELAVRAEPTGDPHTQVTSGRIRERADKLVGTVASLTTAAVPTDTEDERRTLRHDLRGAVGYVISACDDLGEGDTAAALTPALDDTRRAAARMLGLIGSLREFHSSDPNSGADAAIRDTLAGLPAAVARAAATADRTEPGRVLLVDDNEYSRDLVARAIRGQGHEVATATGGREAMARLSDPAAPPVDVVVCDLLMPGVTGIDLLKWAKADPMLWAVPVIVISALGDDDGAVACIAAGAEDYLTRPVKPELLRARIAGCLEKKRLRDREVEYQARIDRLVRAIFPPAAVDEWRQHEAIRPRRHDKVGVLFTDVAGFTAWCEQRRDRPEEVVDTLQDLIARFERSAARHGAQKIKTVGDAFMAVSGLTEGEPNPALALVRLGLDLIADAAAHPAGWTVRVGVHVGPVVTGVLGQTQFTFDVWGHTVNAAARMESNGIPGRVTLSAEAWADVAAAVDAEPRDAAVKGIGPVTVWDVTGLK
jgi:class 3 adenylate cyclase